MAAKFKHRYTRKELRKMTTLWAGQVHDCKFQQFGTLRVLWNRMDEMVEVEEWSVAKQEWVTTDSYMPEEG